MTGTQQITLDLSEAFLSAVNLQKLSADSEHCEITVPKALLIRECRMQGMTPAEFLEKYQAVWHYGGGFKGCYITFERKPEKEKEEGAAHGTTTSP